MVMIYQKLMNFAQNLVFEEGQIVIKNRAKPTIFVKKNNPSQLRDIAEGEQVYFHGSDTGVQNLIQEICEKEKAKLETFKVINKRPKKAIQIKVVYKSQGQDKTISRILRPSL
jgi:hypothetical protein